ncbi:hypothetical protein [Haloarcula montana]|uniref:hypothetical protein n=1 Tax=Haloarcula montana TaxID=3111776 RepID=UPI002D76DA07|nr:hypothetical protein [Haloarcula sp. GH36]
MRRRHFLGLCGSLVAGTAGCLQGTDGPADSPERRTDRSSTTPTTAPATGSSAVEITSAAVQPGVVGPNTPDSIGVFDEFGQYLVVQVSGAGPAYDAFEFRFDGQRFSPTTLQNGLYRDEEWGVRYSDGSGPVLFGLPETGDASDARLQFGERTWEPPQPVRDRLEAPLPTFDVTMRGPDRAGPNRDPVLLVTVTNEGDRSGWYTLALNRSGPLIASAPLRRIAGTLDPGQERTITHDARSPFSPDADPHAVTYRLDTPGDDPALSHTIEPTERTKTPGWTDEGTATASGAE